MNEIIETLNDWIAWFENPREDLPMALVSDSATIGYHDCGFCSNRFICRFETEKVSFDVALLMNDRDGEENAAAIVKLARVALATDFDEKIRVRVTDEIADYNGGTLDALLSLIDRLRLTAHTGEKIIYP